MSLGALFVLSTLFLTGCFVGVPGDSAPPTSFQGRIIFEQAHSNGFVIPQGVMSYNLASEQMLAVAQGRLPRQPKADIPTTYLQACNDKFYRVAQVSSQGLIQVVTPCSNDISNPSEDVFMLGDATEFGLVNSSHDGQRISVTAYYPIINEAETHVVGTQYNTLVYSQAGELQFTFADAYDATWLADGRMLYAFGSDLFITDAQLGSVSQVTPDGLFANGVNNPAVHPDGQSVVFEFNNQIWQIQLDGSNPRKILESDSRLRHPTWSPDGKYLLFTSWDLTYAQALKSFFVYDIGANQSYRIDIDHLLETLGEPWGPYSWISE